MKNIKKNIVTLVVLLLVTATVGAQRRPPEIGRKLPDPGPDRIEVRFALGEKAVKCDQFHLTAKVEGRVIMDGEFASGFQIPSEAPALPRNDALELGLKCGHHRWHFTKVGERAFLAGWVGTDYPFTSTVRKAQGPRAGSVLRRYCFPKTGNLHLTIPIVASNPKQ